MNIHRVENRYIVALAVLNIGKVHILAVNMAKIVLVKGLESDICTNREVAECG